MFLDRDGVLNRTEVRDGMPRPPTDVSQLVILPGVMEGCRSLREEGWLLVMVTNQPDVQRGRLRRADVEEINARLRELLALDDVRVCYHVDTDGCRCRKPEPGMLLEAAAAFDVDLATSFMIGDRWRDVEAGRRAGCRTVLVGPGYAERERVLADLRAPSFTEAVAWIRQQTAEES